MKGSNNKRNKLMGVTEIVNPNHKRKINEDTTWVDLGSGNRPTNSTAQTFGLFYTGINLPVIDQNTGQDVTVVLGGLGGVEAVSSQVTYGGEGGPVSVDPPTYNQLAVAGFAKPLGKYDNFLRKTAAKKASEINDQLDSSEDFTKKIGADALMKARVEKWMDEYKPGDPVWSNDGIIVWTPANDPDIEPDTYQNYMPKKGIDVEWFRQGGTNMDARYYRWGGGDASVKAGLTFNQVFQRGIEYANQYMTDKQTNSESGTKNWNFVGPVYDPVKEGQPPSKTQGMASNIGAGIDVFTSYLNPFSSNETIDTSRLGKKWMDNHFFPNVQFSTNKTVVRGDVVIGSGQPAKYNSSTGKIEVEATFDFTKNPQELKKAIENNDDDVRVKKVMKKVYDTLGAEYGLDANIDPLGPLLGPLGGVFASKIMSMMQMVGGGKPIPIKIEISPRELKKKNLTEYEQLVLFGIIPRQVDQNLKESKTFKNFMSSINN